MDAHRLPGAQIRQLRCLVGLCLCFSLLLSLPVLYLLRHITTTDGEVPTGKMPEAQRLDAHDHNCCNSTSIRKARTHLAGAQKQSSCMPGSLPILYWRNDRTHEEDTITYSDGYLTVPETGDYFVYTQVSYRCPDGKCENLEKCMINPSEKTIITQIISKISSSYGSEPKQQLITSTSIGEKEMWKKTLYLGGILELRERDKLMVNVSNPELVDIALPAMTFFGAFLI
ncbi:tumor necrosis factor ligand superfamily member 15 [Anolis carolinensis]|uniref:Tumor necrosis factor ligand superfamily member 15 n=1 Tax=Anolis carolinensis TaxID=28377 RepID=A0A803TH39_ANOCA|nr:PREDICTED: tumor necrosis factor ligand superfamily member 15 [Anolis carolinensis]|eukprot:XP_008118964.1 PREDICTED: tumor necrosis factor ligand superfamily member 15 [Anolis carolinensis]